MHMYQCEPDEECARSWTYKLRESDEAGRIFFMPSGQYKSSYRFPSSKIKQQDEDMKEITTEIKVKMYYTTQLSQSVFLPVSLR